MDSSEVKPSDESQSQVKGSDAKLSAFMQEVALEAVRYDTQTGLVPVVVQDAHSGQVLMQAYANREALKRTLATGFAWFWSRSRSAYWQKGATSGNVQRVLDVRLDCDGDSVLYLVEPAGPACHTGETSCYFRQIGRPEAPLGARQGTSEVVAQGPRDGTAERGAREQPSIAAAAADVVDTGNLGNATSQISQAEVNATQPAGDILSTLWELLGQRFVERPAGSYTSYLFEQGVDKIAKKVGEEGVEVAIAAKNAVAGAAGRVELAAESADLLFHLMALWKLAGLTPQDVWDVLHTRHLPAQSPNESVD